MGTEARSELLDMTCMSLAMLYLITLSPAHDLRCRHGNPFNSADPVASHVRTQPSTMLQLPSPLQPGRSVMVKMDSPKLVPPGTNFSINKDPLELILLQIWTPSEKFGPPPTNELM